MSAETEQCILLCILSPEFSSDIPGCLNSENGMNFITLCVLLSKLSLNICIEVTFFESLFQCLTPKYVHNNR